MSDLSKDIVQSVSVINTWSAVVISIRYSLPRLRTKFQERTFSHVRASGSPNAVQMMTTRSPGLAVISDAKDHSQKSKFHGSKVFVHAINVPHFIDIH